MALKERDIYIENIRIVSLTAGLKMEGIVKWRGLKSQGPLYEHDKTEIICRAAYENIGETLELKTE